MEFINENIYSAMSLLEDESIELAYDFIKSVIQYRLYDAHHSDNPVVKALMALII